MRTSVLVNDMRYVGLPYKINHNFFLARDKQYNLDERATVSFSRKLFHRYTQFLKLKTQSVIDIDQPTVKLLRWVLLKEKS